MNAKVFSVNISGVRGPKEQASEIILIKGKGVAGDAHANGGARQVSFLAKESHDKFQPLVKVCLKAGIFGENITTEGVVLTALKLGDRLKIGNCLLEVSQIGKECHAPCSIGRTVGRCIMPEESIFCRVIEGGRVRKGDSILVL